MCCEILSERLNAVEVERVVLWDDDGDAEATDEALRLDVDCGADTDLELDAVA